MSKFLKKVCSNSTCGTIFQPRREDHEYCSSSCRTQAFRKRHELEEPSFLSPLKKSIGTPLKAVEAIPSDFPNNTHSTIDRIPDFINIGVTEYIANPAYVKSAKEYHACLDNTLLLERKRRDIKSEINKLNGGSSRAKGTILGGLVAVGLALTTMYSKSKSVNTIWLIAVIPLAVVGGFIGRALWVAAHFGSNKAQKLAEANEKEIELLQIEQQILISKTKEKDVKIERDTVQQQIARYDKIIKDEDYIAYQDVTNQKAIPLESLKNKKFETLPFSDKWEELIGTPAANFCMMISGKPGQGKSYFSLELSAYLASNFGTVLFNSSEEGASLSLQNKTNSFDITNIYLGEAKDVNSLQLLLSNSPYRFVVIDSVNDMNISPQELRKLRGLHPTKGFICIFQSTKDGSFKGSSKYEHDADISIIIENRKLQFSKNRFK